MKVLIITCLFLILPLSALQAETKCVAHRGNRQAQLENSMAALLSAYQIGAHATEFDVHHTKDGIPLIMHDKDLKRTAISRPQRKCPLKKNIDKLTLQDIRQNCLLKNGEEIPSLEDFLSFLHDKDIMAFIEFKDHPQIKTIELILHFYAENKNKLRFISFHKEYLDYLADNPQIRDVKSFHVRQFFNKPKSPYGIDIRFGFKRVERMTQYKDRESGIWTVDDPGKMLWAIYKKIDFITTNRPEQCLRLISHQAFH